MGRLQYRRLLFSLTFYYNSGVKSISSDVKLDVLLEKELESSTVAKFATTSPHGAISEKLQTHMTDFYNLDVIISVGYRVKSKRGIEFRRWANTVLKKYIIDGYAINEKRLIALEKTVDIQTRRLADALNVEEKDILRAVNQYTEALILLDQYDHGVNEL